jgi:predicted Zn-dependent protease
MKYLHRPRAALSFRLIAITGCVLAASAFFGSPAGHAKDKEAPVPPGATPAEVEMGKKALEQLSKDPTIKYIDDKDPKNQALLVKLNDMAKKIGKVSARPDIQYEVKIIDDPGLNAFTLPNGHLYFNKGLIDAAGSDDEIASVMAHEIGHNARMHIIRMQQKTKPLNWVSIAAMLAMLAGRSGADIAQITPYILTGIVNSYSVDYEEEADAEAIPMMVKTGYNPSSLVTFMNKLADEERRRPKVELGIFQTHPPSPERAAAALATLKKLNIPYNPRAVEGGSKALVAENDAKNQTVTWNKVTLLELPGADSQKRAQKVADQINTLMRANLRLHEINVTGDDQSAGLAARGENIVNISAAEAKALNSTPLVLVKQWRKNFERLFWTETFNGSL